MNNCRIERPNYFTGEALLTDDFICEQQYQMSMLAANNLSLHTYGIAQGLEVAMLPSRTNPQAVQVEVTRGMALDALGRQIILLQPAVLGLDDADPGVTYFITINYHDVFADFSDETGTAGYKRIVQQPQIKYLRNLDEPGINILLAVISVTTEGSVNSLTYKSGRNQRRYVGSSVGSIDFVTEGSGVNPGVPASAGDFKGAKLFTDYASISSKRDGSTNNSGDYYLEFDAPRGQFLGLLTTRNNLGVGNDHPVANLQVDAVKFKGSGAISSNGPLVTFSDGPSPFLQVGDRLVSDPSVGGGPAQTVIVKKVVQAGAQVNVEPVFNPPLQKASYTYIRSALARFSAGSDSCLLQVNVDGVVGLGVQAALQEGGVSAGPNALTITTDRKVGIALSSAGPRATLDVNGQIMATGLSTSGAITANGAITALSFEGNGAKLKGMAMLSYWTKATPGASASKLYYNSGNVGVMDSNPAASLSVGGGNAFIGNGVISSFDDYTIVGYQTTFQDQVKVGDQIVIGTLIEQTAIVASKPDSDNELTLQTQFEVPVLQSAYSYLPVNAEPGAGATPGTGTVTSNGTTITGVGTKFTDLNAGDVLIIPRFSATSNVQQGQKVSEIKDDTHLTLAAAFTGVVAGLPYSVQSGSAEQIAGAGTISSAGTAVSGEGTNFLSTVKVGDTLYTNPVQPNGSGFPEKWEVKSVESQTRLTLLGKEQNISPQFTAATSAYMVSSGLLAQFKANALNAVLSPELEAALPPAMLIVTNNDQDKPNTVAINVDQAEVLRSLALQVVGDVSFSGGTVDSGDLTVDTLLARKSVTIGSGVASGPLLSVGSPAAGNPLLVVTPTNVCIGQSSGTATLDVKGTIAASGDIASATQVQAATLNSIGNVNALKGNVQADKLVGNQLDVTGLQINAAGNVQIFGTRVPSTLSGSTVTQTAQTDGFVFAMVGQVTQADVNYMGMLTGSTSAPDGTVSSSVSVTAQAVKRVVDEGKKGTVTYYVPVPATFTMPVKKGENWTLLLTTYPQLGSVPQVTYYWIPLGSATPPGFAASSPPPGVEGAVATAMPVTENLMAPPAAEARASGADAETAPVSAVTADAAVADATHLPHPARSMLDAVQQLQDRIQASSTPAGMVASAQQAIDRRVSDLTQVFGNLTQMSDSEEDRSRFIQDLQKIVCSPSASGQVVAKQVEQQHIQDLVNTFGKASGHVFTPEQSGLLAAGVHALVQINDNEANRNDLNLIKKNIGMFIDNVQQVLQTQFSSSDQRLLTRALMRLVGDGRQGPDTAANASAAPAAAANAAPATTADTVAERIGQHLENALGDTLQTEAKPALAQLVHDALQASPVASSAATLLQDVEKILPASLSDDAKQALQAKLKQLFAQHATQGFMGEVEQAVEQALGVEDKQGLQSIVDGALGGAGTKESTGQQLISWAESAAKGALAERATSLLIPAVTRLLAALF
ncbi:MAG: hypothetical protein HYZ65_08695 [Burkholderiales bacterium]|nr:hypothetical protein [Burkholderiales bacterium]